MLIKAKVLQGWGPGGWQFYQPETNWHAPNPLAYKFEEQVNNIIEHRKANPRFSFSTDPIQVAEELEKYTLARWRSKYSEHGMQKFLEGGDPNYGKKKAPPRMSPATPVSLPRVALAAGAALAGVDDSVVQEWLGAGGVAVPYHLATQRATVCKDCPGNQKVGWRDTLTVVGAKALREYLAAKNQMSLYTPLDGELGMCKACGCHLPLKIWCPIEHFRENVTAEVESKLREYNPKCWGLVE